MKKQINNQNKNFCLHDICGAKKWKHLILETEPKIEEVENEILYTIQHNGFKSCQELDDLRQHWIANDHCSTLFIPQPFPNLQLPTKRGTYLYRNHITNCRPDKEYFRVISKVYTKIVSQLNIMKPSARNFMMPNCTLGLKSLDPDTRRLTINGLAKYLRSQDNLQCVVLENSKLAIKPFLILLLALAVNSGMAITKLYLWRALNFADIPFLGPLPDAKYNNNLRPRPPTVHLNGRKYLEELKKSNNNVLTSKGGSLAIPQIEIIQTSESEDIITGIVNDIIRQNSSASLVSTPEEGSLDNWIQKLILQAVEIKNSDKSLTESKKSQSLYEWSINLLLDNINFENVHDIKGNEELNDSKSKESIHFSSNYEQSFKKTPSKVLNKSLTESNKSQSLYEWSTNLLLDSINFEFVHDIKRTEELNGSKSTKSINLSSNHEQHLKKTPSKVEHSIVHQNSVRSIGAATVLSFPLKNVPSFCKNNRKSNQIVLDRSKSNSMDYSSLIPENESNYQRGSQTVALTSEEINRLLYLMDHSEDEIKRVPDLEKTIRMNKIKACQVYLDFHKYSNISKHVLREIYKISLSGLCNLTTLSINYSYLADDTGKAIMSLGSILSQTLRNIELLCSIHDIPWKTSRREMPRAMHGIPDIAWKQALKCCPNLKIHLVIVSISTFDEVKFFYSKSMPLISFHMDTGVPVTGEERQYNYGSTFKTLAIYYAEILESVVLVFWRASIDLDTVYLKFLREMKALNSFELFGCIGSVDSMEKICEIILKPECTIMHFKLSLQEDPCQAENSRKIIADLAEKYNQRFEEKGAVLDLDTYKI